MAARHGCSASDFLFTMAFDPIFRQLNGVVIPRDPSLPQWLQPTPCAWADHVAVSAPSIRTLMPAVALAFRTIDLVTDMNFNPNVLRCSTETKLATPSGGVAYGQLP